MNARYDWVLQLRALEVRATESRRAAGRPHLRSDAARAAGIDRQRITDWVGKKGAGMPEPLPVPPKDVISVLPLIREWLQWTGLPPAVHNPQLAFFRKLHKLAACEVEGKPTEIPSARPSAPGPQPDPPRLDPGRLGHSLGMSVRPPLDRLPEHLVGNEEARASLLTLLDEPGLAVIHGMGGCGKTAAALWAAREAIGRGVPTFWVAASAATLPVAMLSVAAELGAPADALIAATSGAHAPIDLVWHYLEASADPWLLVVDNADDPAALAADSGRAGDGNGWVRCPSRGTVLVTTRHSRPSAWGRNARVHRFPLISRRSAADLLIRLSGVGPEQEADAEALAVRLGCLPLALTAAGQYLRNSWRIRTLSAYAKALDERFEDVIDGGSDGVSSRSVAEESRTLVLRTWDLSLDLIAEQGFPEARDLLAVLSCFAAGTPIPLDLLSAASLADSGALARPDSASYSDHRVDQVVNRLAAGSLIETQGVDLETAAARPGRLVAPALVVHPVVSESVAAHVTRDPRRLTTAWRAVSLTLTSAAGFVDPLRAENWSWWRLLVPHVQKALGRAPETDLLTTQGLVRAGADTVRFLLALGDQASAQELARLTAARAGHLPRADPSALAANYALASANYVLDVARTRTILEGMLGSAADSLGADHPQTLLIRYDLARVLRVQGHLEESESETREVLAHQRRILGPDHEQTLTTAHELATVLRYRGEPRAAETVYRDLLRFRAAQLGGEHPETLRTRHGLALAIRDQGDLGLARSAMEDLLAARTSILGVDHLDTIWTQKRLCEVLVALGDFERAALPLHHAARAYADALGPHRAEVVAAGVWLQALRSSPATTREGQCSGAAAGLDLVARILETLGQEIGQEHVETRQLRAWLTAARRRRHP